MRPRRIGLPSKEARAALPAPSALDSLCAIFGLSPFERAVLLLCAGIELDTAFAAECAAAQGDRQRAQLTFSLALAALPEPHWSALTPNAPLRYWRLIDLAAGPAVTTSPLRIDERILHFLAGVPGVDERLAGYLEPVPRMEKLPPTHQDLADRIARNWSRRGGMLLPVMQLCGRDPASKRSVAAAACASLGINLYGLSSERLPQAALDLELLQRFWNAKPRSAAGRCCWSARPPTVWKLAGNRRSAIGSSVVAARSCSPRPRRCKGFSGQVSVSKSAGRRRASNVKSGSANLEASPLN